jgi:hypothetical protein
MVTSWRRKFAERLVTVARAARTSEREGMWIGGSTFHEDGFFGVLCPLLGLWALAPDNQQGFALPTPPQSRTTLQGPVDLESSALVRDSLEETKKVLNSGTLHPQVRIALSTVGEAYSTHYCKATRTHLKDSLFLLC